jgi:hypothetical protein
MRLTTAHGVFALAAAFAACESDFEGGGRRVELPEDQPSGGAAGAGGAGGAGGFGLSGSSDSGVDAGPDVDIIEDCPVDPSYTIETGVACTATFPGGFSCRRDDGAECVCPANTLVWDCG